MEIVDVTLRESVYTDNNINYRQALNYIYKINNNIKDINYVEIGYLDNKEDKKYLAMYNEEYINKVRETLNSNIKISIMLHLEKFNPDKWNEKVIDKLDMVRILIDNNYTNLKEVVRYFHSHNVKVSVNCAYISKKTKEQFEEIISKIIESNTDLIFIADTNGSMDEKNLLNCINLIKKKKNNMPLGIHTHNHMNLALSNAYNMLGKVELIDASINGFGKGAGNARLETLILLISRDRKQEIDNKNLYCLYDTIKFFYEEILNDNTKKYVEDFANLLYAYKNMKLKEINEFQKIEREDRIEKILNIENNKLQEAINYIIDNTPYYHNNELYKNKKFKELPILDKNEYRKNVPPLNDNLISRKIDSAFIFSTSGTTGTPQFVTRDVNDINYQVNDYNGLNIGKDDIVLNLFWAGIWGIYTTANLTLEKMGATVIPVGGNNINEEVLKNIEYIITKFNVNVLFGVPSTIVSITKYLKKNNKCISKINKIFCLGEKMYEDTYKYLRKVYGEVKIKTKYGCMESAGIGYQCKNLNCNHYHIFKNRYVEILDIDTNEPLKIGQQGKIVVTTLNKRLVPLIRYNTGDIGSIERVKCDCGEELVLKVDNRIGKEFIIGSTHLKSDDIEEIIKNNSMEYKAVQIVIEKEKQMDKLSILIASDKININGILTDINLKYPDIKILIDENKINKISVKKSTIDELFVNKKTGKIYPIIDKRN